MKKAENKTNTKYAEIVRPGDLVRVHSKIVEGDKTRLQVFEGTVIALKGTGEGKSIVVRKISIGAIGVERIWPLNCPSIAKIEIKKKGEFRKAKLYRMRNVR